MTREEAIRKFKGIIGSLSISIAQADFYPSKAELNELCNMAIEALQGDMYCPNCGVRLVQEDEYLEPKPTHGRLIDADALSKKLCETTIFIKDGEVFQRMINDAPTVQADRPHGEWIEKNSHTYICDHCGFEQAIYGNLHEYNLCPNCGSDMRRKKCIKSNR